MPPANPSASEREAEARKDVPALLALMDLEQYAAERRYLRDESISAESVADTRLGELRGKVIATILAPYADLRARVEALRRGKEGGRGAVGIALKNAHNDAINAVLALLPTEG